MPGLLQRFLPREVGFFDLFVRQAANIHGAGFNKNGPKQRLGKLGRLGEIATINYRGNDDCRGYYHERDRW
jgi:hypothetical protein